MALGAPEVRLDHNCVPCVAVRKVNLEVGPILSPTQAPLYQAPEPQQKFQDRDQISLGLPGGWCVSAPPPPLIQPSHAVLALTVRQQQP